MDYDPTYPKKPHTFAQYTKKFRKDKGFSGRKFAERLGVATFTVIKWEGGRMPGYKKQVAPLREGIRELERFLFTNM